MIWREEGFLRDVGVTACFWRPLLLRKASLTCGDSCCGSTAKNHKEMMAYHGFAWPSAAAAVSIKFTVRSM